MTTTTPGAPTPAVAQRQNDEEMVDLICASSYYYGWAKRWRFLRVVGTIGLALLAPVITFWTPGIAPYVAAAAAAWVFIARILFGRLEDGYMLRGVTAQEQFDTEVFGLPWHAALAGERLAHQDVVGAARRLDVATRDRKRNWYADADAAPWPLNVLLCQQASAVWGRRSHGQYANVLTAAAVIWFVAGVIMGWAADISLSNYLVGLLLPSLPAFLDALELARAHRSASTQKGNIERLTNHLWDKAVDNPSSVGALDCRVVQDHSYRHRRHNPQVAEWYYRFTRDAEEQNMREATERKLAELRRASWWVEP